MKIYQHHHQPGQDRRLTAERVYSYGAPSAGVRAIIAEEGGG